MFKRLIFIFYVLLGLSCESDKSKEFIAQIESNLNYVTKEFESENNTFLVSISHNDTCVLQITHRSLIEKTKKQSDIFGFALNLTFDTTLQSERKLYNKFIQLDIAKEFVSYNWDGIPCFTFDFAKDTKAAAKTTTLILKDLFELDESSKLKIDVTNEGKL